MVQLVDKSVKCPKELSEVCDAVVALVEDIKAGKDLVAVASENLQNISKAIEGVDKIKDELKEALPECVNAVGSLASGLVKALVK